MTTHTPKIALAAALSLLAFAHEATAQRRGGGMAGARGGGGMVGNRGGMGGAMAGRGGGPSFSPAARPNVGAGARPGGGFNPGNMARPGGGAGNFNPGNRPGGGNFNPGNRPGAGGIGERPSFGGLNPGNRPGAGGAGTLNPNLRPGGGNFNPGNRPGAGGAGTLNPALRPGGGGFNPGVRPGGGGAGERWPGAGNRPGGIVGPRPNFPNRPGDGLGLGGRNNLVNRPNIGTGIGNNIGNRTNIGGNTNIGNNIGSNNVVNRPTNINNFTNVSNNSINSNIANVNRGGYGGYGNRGGGWGYGGGGWGNWGGGYGGWGGYRANPYAAYHQGWVNGSWNGNYNRGWGWGGWGTGLALGTGLGLSMWGMGSMLNSWGYSSFVNPYYSTAYVAQPTAIVQPVVYDYSRPLDLTAATPAQAVVDQSVATLDSARAAFQAGDYSGALAQANQALQQTPNDPVLHQFRATCLFALARYDEAAAPMYTVLSAGPGWDWTTLSGLYPRIDVYTEQLRALEAYCNGNPRAASARFVLASFYMTQGSIDAALEQFKAVVTLQPQDRLSAQLAQALSAPAPTDQPQVAAAPAQAQAAAPAQPAVPAESEPPAGPPLPSGPVPAKLVGSWKASPAQGVAITLSLDDKKGFTWSVDERGQSRSFRGPATFDGDTLALSPPNEPPMVGKVTWKDDTHFQFQALGAPPSDPGLSFGR